MTATKRRNERKRGNSNLFDGVLDQRMLLYALTAGAALASAQPAHAEILFTPSNEIYNGQSGTIMIDMDNDGSFDFSLLNLNWGCSSSTHVCSHSYLVRGAQPDNQVALGLRGEAALHKGARVGVKNRFGIDHMAARSDELPGSYFGSWTDVQHGYLGVKFLINGEIHYGWIGFHSVSLARGFRAAFGGWAYETEPNKAIRAGDMGTGEPEPAVFHPAEPTSLELLSAGHVAHADWLHRSTE